MVAVVWFTEKALSDAVRERGAHRGGRLKSFPPAYLENGGSLETAQAIAAHESPRTTKLYDRTGDTLSLDEIERITI